jgi:hypothetical protein
MLRRAQRRGAGCIAVANTNEGMALAMRSRRYRRHFVGSWTRNAIFSGSVASTSPDAPHRHHAHGRVRDTKVPRALQRAPAPAQSKSKSMAFPRAPSAITPAMNPMPGCARAAKFNPFLIFSGVREDHSHILVAKSANLLETFCLKQLEKVFAFYYGNFENSKSRGSIHQSCRP